MIREKGNMNCLDRKEARRMRQSGKMTEKNKKKARKDEGQKNIMRSKMKGNSKTCEEEKSKQEAL